MPGWLWLLAGFALGIFVVGFLFFVAITEGWKELFKR